MYERRPPRLPPSRLSPAMTPSRRLHHPLAMLPPFLGGQHILGEYFATHFNFLLYSLTFSELFSQFIASIVQSFDLKTLNYV